LHLYDELSAVQLWCGMRTTDPGDAARIELLLAELRLPAVKQV
jgi:hypothetical protein